MVDARWRLLGFEVTLEVESAQALDRQISALAIASDGDNAYALAGGGTLLHLDLLGGVSRPVMALPVNHARSVVVTAERVYVPDTISPDGAGTSPTTTT